MDKKIKKTVFRFGLLNDVLLKVEAGGKITSLFKTLSSKTHIHPIKGETSISIPTLFRHLKLFKQGGIDALKPKTRSDKGKPRKINEQTIQKAINLRKDNPSRTTEKLINILQDEYSITGVKAATLNYHLDLRGYSRRQLKVYDTKIHIRFENKNANDLWIGDYHDKNQLLSLSSGKFAYLSAFIDCHSRYVVHAEYYLKENVMTLEDSFKKAILKWGVPKRIYVDNAKIYRSHRFDYACAKLGIKLIFSKAYIKESRGKIEKFFRYVKENFEQEVIHREGFETIEQLNKHFWAWLEMDYHQRIHSEIQTTPDKRFNENLQKRTVDLSVLHELFMLEDKRTVDRKTCVVSVLGKKYQTESFLAGRKVNVHYNPNDLSYVIIYCKDRYIHKAFPQQLNKKLPATTPDPSYNLKYDYLSAVEGKYNLHLGKNILPIKFTTEKENKQTIYNYLEFKKDIKQQLSIIPIAIGTKHQNTICEDFYNQYAPFERELVIKALTYAKQKYEGEYSIELYIAQIKLFVLNERSK